MKSIVVQTENPYEVRIERGILTRAGASLKALFPHATAAVVTDDTVDALYGATVERSLQEAGFATVRMCFAHGEGSKTLATYADVLAFLAEHQLTRSDVVVVLGGGVAGDLAGFAAATYLRGIAVVQVPTTLLAMVDSSVGGKTGVDLPCGKNLVGAFHQPRLVLCDPDTLATLPTDTLADGMAEAIKYGVLGSESLFEALAEGDFADHTEEILAECVMAKATLVAQDATDRGSRQLLNLGHTIGHAIEQRSGYTVSHGHAVAIGMVCVTRLAQRLGLCDASCLPRLMAALQANALPTATAYTPDELLDTVRSDKKRMGDRLTLVLPRKIGLCELHPVPVDELPELLAKAIEE